MLLHCPPIAPPHDADQWKRLCQVLLVATVLKRYYKPLLPKQIQIRDTPLRGPSAELAERLMLLFGPSHDEGGGKKRMVLEDRCNASGCDLDGWQCRMWGEE